MVNTGSEGFAGYGGWGVGSAHIVGVIWHGSAVVMHWRTPSMTVYFIVIGVGVVESRVVIIAVERVVGRHGPIEVGGRHRAAESQVLCGAVHAVAHPVVKPDAGEVYRHVNLFAGVGIVAVKPDLVIFAVDRLGPYLVDDDIGGEFVFIAAVNHQFGLSVESVGYAGCLWTGEVAHRVGRSSQGHRYKC